MVIDSKRRMEKVSFLSILLFSFLAVLIWKYNDSRLHFEDHVYIKQLTENLASTGEATSDAQDAINDMLFSGFLTTPPEELCISPMAEKSHSDNLFSYHPYFILYLIAPTSKLLNAELVLTTVTVAGFFLLLLLMYENMRTQGVTVLVAGGVVLMATFHPVWSQGLQGQMYVERFFIPLAALLIWLLNREQRNFWLIVLLTTVCALVTERTGLIIGTYLVLHALLYAQTSSRDRLMLAGLGILSVCYSVALIMLYLDNDSYATGGFLPHSFGELLVRLENEAFSSKLQVFLFFNVLILGIFSIWDWRAFLIALVMMVPNIIGTIGGAEKTGFLTHYHSLYTPFLFMAISSGVVRLYRKSWTVVSGRRLVSWLLMFMIPTVGMAKVKEANRVSISTGHLGSHVILKSVKQVPECFEGGEIYQWRKNVENIRRVVPEGSKVSVAFWGMPILENNRSVYYYPLGIDVADYVLIKYKKVSGNYNYLGAISYLGTESQEKLNQCMNKRLRNDGYDVENPMIFGDSAVLRRINQKD